MIISLLFRLSLEDAYLSALSAGSQRLQPWITAHLSSSLQVWMQTSQLVPTSPGIKGSSRWFKGHLAQSINKSYLSWCTAHPSPTTVSPWYFQSQARVPRIIRFSRSSFIQSHNTGEYGVLLRADHALTLSCRSAAPPRSKAVPLLPALWVRHWLSSTRLPLGGSGALGDWWKGSITPYILLHRSLAGQSRTLLLLPF